VVVVADTDQERGDLNALIRSAHEAVQDLRAAEKKIDEKIATANEVAALLQDTIRLMEEGIKNIMETQVREFIEANTVENIEAYNQAWQDNIRKAEQAIYRRFDILFTEVVGSPLAKGFPSIAQAVTGRKQ